MFKNNNLKQGLYTPRHPEKYVGDPTKIRYMSSWELTMHTYLDNNPNILRWASEEIPIPYIHPVDGKFHDYYPDYYVEYVDVNGIVHKEIIEVKPDKQTKVPTRRGKSKKTQLNEAVVFAINQAKWKYAQIFCDAHNFHFRIITENHLFK